MPFFGKTFLGSGTLLVLKYRVIPKRFIAQNVIAFFSGGLRVFCVSGLTCFMYMSHGHATKRQNVLRLRRRGPGGRDDVTTADVGLLIHKRARKTRRSHCPVLHRATAFYLS